MVDKSLYMKATGPLYQWLGEGTPSMFCILEGSANMVEASAAPGRQFISEPPMQLWGAAVRERKQVRGVSGGRERRDVSPRAALASVAGEQRWQHVDMRPGKR